MQPSEERRGAACQRHVLLNFFHLTDFFDAHLFRSANEHSHSPMFLPPFLRLQPTSCGLCTQFCQTAGRAASLFVWLSFYFLISILCEKRCRIRRIVEGLVTATWPSNDSFAVPARKSCQPYSFNFAACVVEFRS